MSNIGMSAMYVPTAALDQEATSGTAPPRPVGYDRVRQALLTRLRTAGYERQAFQS